MVFDTLFALDSKLAPKPMMVESETGQRRRPDLYLHAAAGTEVPRRQPGHLARRGGLAAALDGRAVDGAATQGAHGVAGRGGRPDVHAGAETALRPGGVHAGRPGLADARDHAGGGCEAGPLGRDHRADRLRPVPLCRERARIRPSRRVREVPGLHPAQRASRWAGRRAGGEGRSRRVDDHPGRPDGGERAGDRRGRYVGAGEPGFDGGAAEGGGHGAAHCGAADRGVHPPQFPASAVQRRAGARRRWPTCSTRRR